MQNLLQLSGVFVTAFIVGLSGAMMPGPLLALTVGESTRRGVRAGPLLMLGHMILEACVVVAVVMGLAGFLRNPVLIACIALAGGVVLCWMGQDMVRSARGASLSLEAKRGSKMHPVAAGIVVSLSNPYWTIWWATIGAGYLIMGLCFGGGGVVAFFTGHILSDFAWYTLVSWGVARGRHILTDRVYRRLIGSCGVFLVAFGAFFLWTGVQHLGTP